MATGFMPPMGGFPGMSSGGPGLPNMDSLAAMMNNPMMQEVMSNPEV